MEKQIKIGFTGNRYGLTPEQKIQIFSIFDKYDNLIVSHGDCIGSDTDFHNLCINYKNMHPNKKIRIDIFIDSFLLDYFSFFSFINFHNLYFDIFIMFSFFIFLSRIISLLLFFVLFFYNELKLSNKSVLSNLNLF